MKTKTEKAVNIGFGVGMFLVAAVCLYKAATFAIKWPQAADAIPSHLIGVATLLLITGAFVWCGFNLIENSKN